MLQKQKRITQKTYDYKLHLIRNPLNQSFPSSFSFVPPLTFLLQTQKQNHQHIQPFFLFFFWFQSQLVKRFTSKTMSSSEFSYPAASSSPLLSAKVLFGIRYHKRVKIFFFSVHKMEICVYLCKLSEADDLWGGFVDSRLDENFVSDSFLELPPFMITKPEQNTKTF